MAAWVGDNHRQPVAGCLWLDIVGGYRILLVNPAPPTVELGHVCYKQWPLHAQYSRDCDIPVFEKSHAFSRLNARTKVWPRYKHTFKLSEFDITRFNCKWLETSSLWTVRRVELHKSDFLWLLDTMISRWKHHFVKCYFWMLFFAVVIISGDNHQFSADSEQEKIDWIQVLQDASRITVNSGLCLFSVHKTTL